MKAKFVVGQKIQLATLPIDATIVAVVKMPKTKYQTSHFAYWCDPGQNSKLYQIDEKDLIAS